MRADVVIVGGGVQGITMALAAARKGLKPVLVERNQLAAGASGNSYGIIHGGLRYLQTLDLARWRRSRRAQRWYLENYPQFVKPLSCVMPLYRGCFRSPIAFQAAGTLEAILFKMLGDEPDLPRLSLIPVEEIATRYPVPTADLVGAAHWYDATISNVEGLLTAIAKEAGLAAESLFSHSEIIRVEMRDGRAAGVWMKQGPNGNETLIETDIVINCTGSWSNQWPDRPAGPTAATLAFNLVFDLPFPGDSALAVSEQPGRGRSFFLRPLAGKTYAGTYYRPAPREREPAPTEEDVREFVAALDHALPGFGLAQAKVLAVMSGLLPDVDGSGRKLSPHDHVRIDDPPGVHTIVGGKLTTAPLLSFEVADRLWPQRSVKRLAA